MASKIISDERIKHLQRIASDDPSLLMGAAILAKGSLSREIQRECIRRFPETEKYFLAHELNQLSLEQESEERVRFLASRLSEIDNENSLGHYYIAALAGQNGELGSLEQRLSIVLASQQFTVYMDK